MKVKFYLATLLALALAGCNNDEMDNPLADGPVPMTFTADIHSVATRTTAGNFENGDVVGIIPIKGNKVEAAQANIAYTYNGSAFTADPPYYFQNNDEVTFNAYYPYQSTLGDSYTLEIDTRNGNHKDVTVNGNVWRNNDYLFASAKTTVGTPSISFTEDAGNPFGHVMSSVAILFKAGTDAGVANLAPLRGYTLGGVVTEGTFDCSTGIVSPKDGVPAEAITVTGILCEESDTEHQTASLILLPQEVNGGKLILKVEFNNTTYTADLPLSKLEAGILHLFPVTIKNTKLEIGTAIIKDWEYRPETGGNAELQ